MANMKLFKEKKILIFLIFIILIIFIIFYYKNNITGNNISIKNNEDVIAYVKNIKNYKANAIVVINSNKTENRYEVYQEVTPKGSVQVVESPEELRNLTIENDENIIKIKKDNSNFEKIYNDYGKYFLNTMYLTTFSKNLENGILESYEENEELILTVKNFENNTYGKYIQLTFDKKEKRPVKIEVKDKNKKTTICILYTDIEIN